nr:MAG: hypothetical protein [Owegonang virus 2]
MASIFYEYPQNPTGNFRPNLNGLGSYNLGNNIGQYFANLNNGTSGFGFQFGPRGFTFNNETSTPNSMNSNSFMTDTTAMGSSTSYDAMNGNPIGTESTSTTEDPRPSSSRAYQNTRNGTNSGTGGNNPPPSMMNPSTTPPNEPEVTLGEEAEESTMTGEAEASAESAGSSVLGPLLVASTITNGLVTANNRYRDAQAQASSQWDAQHVAQIQDATDEKVAQIGMGVTAGLGAVAGTPGIVAGVIGTGIAEALDTVSPNQTMSTAGYMSSAAQGV